MWQRSMGMVGQQGLLGLRAALTDYRGRWPIESGPVDEFLKLIEDEQDPFVRARLAGHFTASAWLVDASGTRILLTHHRKLDRWLQLGGHADGDRDLASVALKEAEEESGLTGLSVEGGIFDLDRHWIPERKEVPGHWHYDVRYVVRAGRDEEFVVSDESHALAWREIASLAGDDSLDPSMHRMARKWLARGKVAECPVSGAGSLALRDARINPRGRRTRR